jgi:hypothetical protein
MISNADFPKISLVKKRAFLATFSNQIRGYEKINEQNVAKVKQQAAEKLAVLKAAHAGLLVS